MTGARLAEAIGVGDLGVRFGGAIDLGLGPRSVQRIVPPDLADHDGDLVLVARADLVDVARERPGVWLCTPQVAGRLPAGRRWTHEHATWVVAELLSSVARDAHEELAGVSCVVSPLARVAATARIGHGAVIHPHVVIGDDCRIGEHVVVHPRVTLGARVEIGAGSVIGRAGFGWVTGPSGEVRRMPQLGGVVIDDDVELGPLCTVDSGTLAPTRIRRGVKLDAHVHVAHNVDLGEGTLVAAQGGFAGSSRVGRGVLMGGQSGVADHVAVGDGARIAAKSAVVRDVPSGVAVAGFPAVPRVRWLRAMARLFETHRK